MQNRKSTDLQGFFTEDPHFLRPRVGLEPHVAIICTDRSSGNEISSKASLGLLTRYASKMLSKVHCVHEGGGHCSLVGESWQVARYGNH